MLEFVYCCERLAIRLLVWGFVSLLLCASHNHRLVLSLLKGFHCVEVRILLSRNESISRHGIALSCFVSAVPQLQVSVISGAQSYSTITTLWTFLTARFLCFLTRSSKGTSKRKHFWYERAAEAAVFCVVFL